MKKQKKIKLNGIKHSYAEYIKTQAQRDRKNNIGNIKTSTETQKKRDNTNAIIKKRQSQSNRQLTNFCKTLKIKFNYENEFEFDRVTNMCFYIPK